MLLRSTHLLALFGVLAALTPASVTAATAVAPATAARPPMVPQASIRGIALGMTPADVRTRLGAPAASGVSPNPIIGKVRIWRYSGLRIVFDGVKAGRTVLSVTTTSRGDRTAADVGIGSTEADVQRLVAGVRCATRYGYRSCMIGAGKPGQVVTDFAISRAGKVGRVALSTVVD